MATFDPNCRACARLTRHLDTVRQAYPHYHARPVAPFGDPRARLLIVGLAPGMHGANATGRPFTGDFAGILLYQTLYDHGLASAPESRSKSDGLKLKNCRITNAVKCLPPENKPNGEEVRTCNPYLRAELAAVPAGAVILALGAVAHQAVIRAFALKQTMYPFVHGKHHPLPNGRHLLDSYHCSRYNTQTGRLTPRMFRNVVAKAVKLLAK
ncbi:MAG: uracil-DNA glycosylase [Acidiferrobacterales bacterium]